MQRLIHDLLEYSRAGSRSLRLEPTDCAAILDEALHDLSAAIEDSGAAVTHAHLPTVKADAVQLSQLLRNLVGNAIKFRGQEPPRVHVWAEPSSEGWRFVVQDNGIGIAPEHAEDIFVVFRRLHGPADYAGSGIGLAVCKRIVERHGGRIWVESDQGTGSTFYFVLPGD